MGPAVEGIIVERVHHVVEVNEEVTDHFARVEGSLVIKRPIRPNIFPQTSPFLKEGLALQEKMKFSLEQRGARKVQSYRPSRSYLSLRYLYLSFSE